MYVRKFCRQTTTFIVTMVTIDTILQWNTCFTKTNIEIMYIFFQLNCTKSKQAYNYIKFIQKYETGNE